MALKKSKFRNISWGRLLHPLPIVLIFSLTVNVIFASFYVWLYQPGATATLVNYSASRACMRDYQFTKERAASIKDWAYYSEYFCRRNYLSGNNLSTWISSDGKYSSATNK